MQTLRNTGRYILCVLTCILPLIAGAQVRMRPHSSQQGSKSPVVKRMATPVRVTNIVTAHSTTIAAGSTKIQIALDLGQPIVDRGEVTWPRLAGVANGIMLEHTGKTPLLAVTLAVPEDGKTFAVSVDQISKQSVSVALPAIPERATVSAATAFRSLRTVTVRIPLASATSVITKLRLALTFASRATSGSTTGDRWFDAMNEHLVANSWDIARFRLAPRSASAHPFATATRKPASGKLRALGAFEPTTFQWIDTSAEYVKLYVTRDGLYRVSASDIKNFDLAAHNFNVANVRCINRGVEVPIWVDTDGNGKIAAIEFYGDHLPGEPLNDGLPEFYNLTSDTNAYWLTTSSKTGDEPMRYVSIAPSATQTVSTGTFRLHHERDLFYYVGDSHSAQDEIFLHPSTYTPGERFEWFELPYPMSLAAPNDTLKYYLLDTFRIPSLAGVSSDGVGRLQILAHGMSTGDHPITLRINGSIVYSNVITDYANDTSRIIFQSSLLREGINTFEVASDTSLRGTGSFYFDHYDLTFDAALAPSADTAIATGQWRFSAASTNPYILTLQGGTAAHLYNLTDRTRLTNFAENTTTPKPEYAAATVQSMLACDRIEPLSRNAFRILDPNNRADYIIITHPEFLRDAQLLSARRANAGMATMVVTTAEVCNAFNFGANEPDAYRRFLSYAYFFYGGQQNYPVGYVTLFGAGTWDPKFNLNHSYLPSQNRTIYRTFVPTYGWPTSDFYYTLVEDGRLDTIQPRMVIARIPVRNALEADAYLKKVQEYEDNAPADWNRRFDFLMGGSGTFQHQQFMSQVDRYMLNPVALSRPPTNIRYKTIERDPKLVQDPNNTTPDPSHVTEIQTDIENGLGLMYFGGHGATFTSDILLPDAGTLHNRGVYPFLFTVSCRTGAFGEPNMPTINSSYVIQPEAGSAYAYGTTGFGDLEYDGRLSEKFFWLMRNWRDSSTDYNRVQHDTAVPNRMNLTAMLTAAKLYASDTAWVGPTAANLRLQYSALGDAALGFSLRPQPELAVHPDDIQTLTDDGLRRTVFSVSDSTMNVSALVHNYGYAAERPVAIRIQDIPASGPTVTVFDTLPRLDDTARVTASFHLSEQSIGEHTIAVSIDPDRQFRRLETDTLDDDASTKVYVNGLAATPFYPWEGARQVCDVSSDAVHFIVLFPPKTASHFQLQLDTTSSFAAPLLRRDTVAGSGYYGTLDVSLAALPKPSSSVYWWRTRIIRTRGDTSAWQFASFSTAPAPRAEFSYTTADQFAPMIVSGLSVDATRGLFLPLTDTIRYDIISHGRDDSGMTPGPFISEIDTNGHPYFQFVNKQGYVIARLSSDASRIDTIWEFSIDYTRAGDTAYTYPITAAINEAIASIPDSTIVFVFTSVQPVWGYLTIGNPNITAALQSLGSKSGLEPVVFFGSYAMIGKKGWKPGMALERFGADSSRGVHLTDTIVTAPAGGAAITSFTAVARSYGTLRATSNTPAGSDIAISVFGNKRDGSGTDRIATLHTKDASSLDLSQTDPRVYDRLGMRIDLARPTSAVTSPELHGIELEYDAAPEFLFTSDSILVQPSSVMQGANVIASYTVKSLTCDSALNVVTQLAGSKIAAGDTIPHTIAKLPGHAAVSISDTILTTNQLGRVALIAMINPNERQNEQLLFNNTAVGGYTVSRDTTKPHADILIGGTHIAPCGFVSDTATTTIELISANSLRVTDSNAIKVTLQGDTLYLAEISASKPQGFGVRFVPVSDGPVQARMELTPPAGFHYSKGQWNVTAIVKDASGNLDTVQQCFTISATNGLDHVMNYPNPFKDKTFFTFELRNGSSADVKIIVYTVAGRKIRTIVPTKLRAGFNMVEWDGRDERGNDVGNGTYLYRVVMNGMNSDGSDAASAVTEKVVRSR